MTNKCAWFVFTDRLGPKCLNFPLSNKDKHVAKTSNKTTIKNHPVTGTCAATNYVSIGDHDGAHDETDVVPRQNAKNVARWRPGLLHTGTLCRKGPSRQSKM